MPEIVDCSELVVEIIPTIWPLVSLKPCLSNAAVQGKRTAAGSKNADNEYEGGIRSAGFFRSPAGVVTRCHKARRGGHVHRCYCVVGML